jgi:hypothetical protein
MIFYAIRHIKSGKLMPEVKTRGGYSHWNPDNSTIPEEIFLDVPRLFRFSKKAKKCIIQWFACQNGRRSFGQNSYTGEYDDFINFEKDGRKKEDLEVIKIELRIKK